MTFSESWHDMYKIVEHHAGSRVHLNFLAGSTFPVPVCTVPLGHWVYKADNRQD